MTATNHVITGAVIAAVIHNPWLCVPLAFLTHFLLDALPHFGEKGNEVGSLQRLKWLLPIDAILAAVVLLTIFVIQPAHWQLIIAGGIACASPDLFQAPRFLRFLRTGNAAPDDDWFSQFHTRIQWCERLWGKWVELAWAGVFLVVLVKLA